MDWRRGYLSTWHLYHVNADTWSEDGEIQNLVSASITKDIESDLIEDADITVDGESVKGYVRLVLEADSGLSNERVPMGTFLVTSPKKTHKHRFKSLDLECYSVLKPASDKLLSPGWYFPEGGDPVAGACQLLNESLIAPVVPTESDIKTEEPKVAENGESYLSMAKYLLDDTDYYISIDQNGYVTVKKKADDIVATFDTYENDIVFQEITDETDVFDIPNILRVTDGSGKYEIIRNEDEESETSIENLGWEKWAAEDVTLEANETLLSKGNERMEELSKGTRTLSYSREYSPNINLNDNVLILLPQCDVIGVFRIKTQNVKMGAGAEVSETSTFETNYWKG